MANEANMFSADDVVTAYSTPTDHEIPVENLPLPPNFKWVTATAAYQVEGAAT